MPRLPFSISHWVPSPLSSPLWCSRTLDLGITGGDPSQLALATVCALQHHGCNLGIKYGIPTLFNGRRVMLPVLEDSMLSPSPSAPVASPAVALCFSCEMFASPEKLALSLSFPVLITHYTLLDRHSLQITFDTAEISRSQAGWVLIHVARAFRHIHTSGMHALPRDSFPGLVEQALLGDSPINARYKHPPLSFVPPTGNLLQDCFAERARSDPLATAIAHVELEGYVSPSCNVSYAAVVALSLELAEKLGSVDVGVGDVVAICVEDVRHVAISTLAVLVCGAAYVILDPGSTYNTALSSLSAVLPGLHVVLSAPRGCGPSAEPGSHLVFVNPGELTLDEASVYCSKSCIPPSLRPDCIQPSATAYLKPGVDLEGRTTWMPVTHEEAIRYLSDEYDTFAGGSDFRVLHLSGILDYFLGMSIWHTLMHRSALCYVPSELQAQFSVTSLIRLTGCTHLAVPLDVSAVVHEEVEKMAANSALAQKKSSLQTLIVPCLSSANWGISSLSHSKIRLMVGDDPSRVKPSPPKPAEISVLQRKPDTDLTPLRVLELIPLGTVIHDLGTRVVQITDDLVVKYGPSVRYVEALNTLHVLERTDIPVPDVYLVFKQGDATYIVMQFIRGRTVQSCWHMLDDSQHQHVASELARYLCELHASSVSTPSKRPGPLDGGKCEGIWFTLYGAGPFATYEDLVCWLNRKLALSGAPTNRQFTTDHPLVFTHQDMSPRNLILDDVNKLWVLDWDMAGWYPAYFDYTCIASDIGTPAVPIPLGWSKTILSHLPDYQENYRLLRSIAWVLDVMPFAK